MKEKIAMEIQLIDINTYAGISSNAKHFYANYVPQKSVEDTLAFDINGDLENLCVYHASEELKYFPTREDAQAYAVNDYPDHDRTITEERKRELREWAVKDLVENGTIRFPSILSIVKTARKKWPDACLYFTFRGKRKGFLKLVLDKQFSQADPEIEKVLLPKR